MMHTTAAAVALLALAAPACFATPSMRLPSDHSVVRVYLNASGSDQLRELALELDLDLWAQHHRDELESPLIGSAFDTAVDVHVSGAQRRRLQQAGLLEVGETLVPDVQAMIDEQWAQGWLCEDDIDHCLDDFYSRYQSLATIGAKLDSLHNAHKDLLSPISVGKSYEGRDLRGVKVTAPGDSSGRRAIFYNCGIHAREWLPVPFCVYMIESLAELYAAGDPLAKRFLESFEFHIVPNLNPDGYVYSQTVYSMWRKSRKPNRDGSFGTDLNRNWEYKWGTGGSSADPRSDAFMGYAPFDNVETRDTAAYLTQLNQDRNLTLYMDIHAFGLMWMFPYGWVPKTQCRSSPRGCGPADEAKYQNLMNNGQKTADAIQAVHGQKFKVGPITWVIYQASGSTVDHIFEVVGADYAYAPEVRAGFQPNPSNIKPSNEELWAGVKAQVTYILEHSA